MDKRTSFQRMVDLLKDKIIPSRNLVIQSEKEVEMLRTSLKETNDLMLALYNNRDIAAGYPYIVFERNEKLLQ